MNIAPAIPQDRHVRRSGDDYATALLELLPTGQAWPRAADSTLALGCGGLAQEWGFVDSRAADLLERESDPRYTVELLQDWERAFGLPDPCVQEPLTIGERRTMLLQRITLLGSQSRQWFIDVAFWLGYCIHIGEYSPYTTGISRCGFEINQQLYHDPPCAPPPPPDPNLNQSLPPPPPGYEVRWQLAPPEIRFYWKVFVDNAKLTWLRAGAGVCGVDPHLKIGLATDLECIFLRWKPAQTDIVFDYSGLSTGGSMAGTP